MSDDVECVLFYCDNLSNGIESIKEGDVECVLFYYDNMIFDLWNRCM